MEKWKIIEEYPNYAVSNMGNVKALYYHNNFNGSLYPREKILKQMKTKLGYMQVSLSNKNARSTNNKKFVHRLVAEAFIPNSNNYKEVNHINGIKTDNRVENLEWCTRSENMLHAYKCGLRKGKTKYNRKLNQYDQNGNFIKQWNNISSIKKELNYDYSSIFQCCNGKRNKAYGFVWKYAEEV